MFTDEPEGLPGFFKISQRISRPRYANYCKIVQPLFLIQKALQGFFGRKDPGGDSRAAFIGAIKFSDTVFALDIAAGGHRQMDSGIRMKASVFFNPTGGLRRTSGTP